MRSLIIGMGIGQLYKTVLEELGHEVITVDSNISRMADFPTVESALIFYDKADFDTVHICTPNFTHEIIARKVAPFSKIVFIEKPGVETAVRWESLVTEYPYTRFMMVKNNMWRDNILELQSLSKRSNLIEIDWTNNDRVPNPGTWFTTKELAYGGVSRDLMPHLLSFWMSMNKDYALDKLESSYIKRNWELVELTNTDYGTVDENGIYDVDDQCEIVFKNKDSVFKLTANWRSLSGDRREIRFHLLDGKIIPIEFGLCPESAYKLMIEDAISNLNNDNFWSEQLEKDLFIHKTIEKL